VNWAQFLTAKKTLLPDDEACPGLMMSGVAHDNATRYLEIQKGSQRDNNFRSLFDGQANQGRDFVWNGSKVQVATGFTSGGHPALAGFDQVLCAGRIMTNYFFFHSGHYQPKKINALHFIVNFVENTCSSSFGSGQDELVAKLCKMKLRLYVENSETETFDTTFEMEAAPPVAELVSQPSRSDHARSAAIPIGGKSAPIPVGGKSVRIPKEKSVLTTVGKSGSVAISGPIMVPASTVQDLGITAPGLFSARNNRWVPDSERVKCALCQKSFSVTTRKHHCRQCGDVFCDDCSKGRKVVKRPAINSPKEEKPDKKVRVCKTCFSLVQLV
jgi:hypothetical protein